MNTSGSGGGVYVTGAGSSFIMTGGNIFGHNIYARMALGGGVYASTFTMTGGKIYGNSAVAYSSDSGSIAMGGGVYVSGTFTKTGDAIINGSNELIEAERNTVSWGRTTTSGAAVQNDTRSRETTAGAGVDLDSEIDGAEGGWEN